MCLSHRKILLLDWFRPSLVNDNLGGRYHTTSSTDMMVHFWVLGISILLPLPLKLSVTEDGLTAEIGITIELQEVELAHY